MARQILSAHIVVPFFGTQRGWSDTLHMGHIELFSITVVVLGRLQSLRSFLVLSRWQRLLGLMEVHSPLDL
jgi:hypothetical protein